MPQPLTFLSPLHRATREIGIHLTGRIAALGLQGTEGHLLSFLRSYAPTPVSEITRVFGLKKSTTTSLLDRLEDRGFLRRRHHPDDGRSFLVELTPRGRKLAERVQRPVEELEKAIADRVGSQDLQGFRRVLEAIHDVTGVQVRREEPSPKERS